MLKVKFQGSKEQIKQDRKYLIQAVFGLLEISSSCLGRWWGFGVSFEVHYVSAMRVLSMTNRLIHLPFLVQPLCRRASKSCKNNRVNSGMNRRMGIRMSIGMNCYTYEASSCMYSEQLNMYSTYIQQATVRERCSCKEKHPTLTGEAHAHREISEKKKRKSRNRQS